MEKNRISSADLLEQVRQTRLREYEEIEPELLLFRASPEEAEAQKIEQALQVEETERAKELGCEMSEFASWAHDLARSGRECVRFERWRDAQPVSPNTGK